MRLQRREFLSAMAVGSLGVLGWRPALAQDADPLAKLTVHTRVPANAEPPLTDLIKSWITPTESFYVRSHAPVPKIDPAEFRLQVEGLVETPLSLSLQELQDFPTQETTLTMTCAGNRRYEHNRVQNVGGVPWQEGAIGNATWKGALLSAVLQKAGLKENAKHVWFDGLDNVDHKGAVIPFGASIPLSKAMNDETAPGTLLCTEMNGAPLTPDHGFPLRTVVPGYIGARSVKWLGKVIVSDRPSTNHFVDDAYKLVTEGTPVAWDEQAPIYRYPLNSVICTPEPGTHFRHRDLTVTGYALPSGDPTALIKSVEISVDSGRTWTKAKITSEQRPYCWVLWKADVHVSPATTEVIVRAHDSTGKSQPRFQEWNLKGYMYNAWHHVPLKVS